MLVRVGVVAGCALLWAAAATFLWQTRVPGDLELPEVPLRDHFTARELERSEEYERFFRVEFIVSQLVLVLVLTLYAWRGARFARESAAGRIGTGMLLGMLGLAVAWLSQLPFRVAEVWWERRYDVVEVGYVEALLDNWLVLGAEFLSICLALLIVMGFAGRFPRHWWLPAAPVFVAIAALFAFALPYLGDTDRLNDPALRAKARALASELDVEEVPIDVEEVSEDTRAPNAYTYGLGPSRRVVLWDTLLEYPDDEVLAVVAHEFGHQSEDHILESLGWYALFAFPGAYLIARVTRRRGGMAEPAAVPLSLLVVVVLSLAALPLENAISRHMEREADWVALETTEDADALESVFRRFTRDALAEPDPPEWSSTLFDSHPTIEDRIAMAIAWRDRRRDGAD